MPLYYGQDDNENTLPYLVGCVFVYLAYKFIKSVNNIAPNKVDKSSKKTAISNDLAVSDKNGELANKEPVKPKIMLKGSLVGLSFKKSERNPISTNEASKDAVDEELKTQTKIVLKGSLAGLSFKKSERETPKLTDQDEDVI